MKSYITPDEACKLSEVVTLQDAEIADSIYKKNFDNDFPSYDRRSAHLCSLAAVFNAGKVAGIRQERERRHDKKGGAMV